MNDFEVVKNITLLNSIKTNSLSNEKGRTSLMPAAFVIPASLVYINIVAVKKFFIFNYLNRKL